MTIVTNEELTQQLSEALSRIAALEDRLAAEQVPTAAAWPTPATLDQGFLAGRWQRRDGATPADGLPPTYVSEAPADGYYYGRYNYIWQQVVEEAPEITARLSVTGWARASFGADNPWIALDDVLADYVQDVPAVNGAYGRFRSASGVQWMDFTTLGVAPLASPQLTGAPTAPTPPAADRSSRLATTQFVADNAGSGGGGITDAPADGYTYARRNMGWQELESVYARIASPTFTGTPMATTPGAGTDSTRLATTQFVARDALMKSGGQMAGPLITIAGISPTNLGLSIGDNSTGFYRPSAGFLNSSVSGVNVSQFMPTICAFFVPVHVGNNVIQAVGDPAQPTDALNLRAADARYLQQSGGFVTGPLFLTVPPAAPNDATNKLYVDQRRAPSLVYDIPNNVVVPGDGGWHDIARVPFTIPRGGNSLVMVIVSGSVTDTPNIAILGVRFVAGTAERRVFTYGGGPPDNVVSGFTVTLTAQVSGPDVVVPVQVSSLSIGGAPPPVTIVGGGEAVAARSQIVIVDLGPVPTTEVSENAESQGDPSGAGRSQRDATGPRHRSHARTSTRAR